MSYSFHSSLTTVKVTKELTVQSHYRKNQIIYRTAEGKVYRYAVKEIANLR